MHEKEKLYKISSFDKIISILIIGFSFAAIILAKWGTSNHQCPQLRGFVYQKGVLIEQLNLNEDRVVFLSDKKTQIEIRGKKIRLLHADCPHKLCENTGWVQHSGQAIVCVPNQLVVAIESKGGPLLDAVCY